MSDPARTVQWQSLALVVAAFITTSGAVSSALIQTGWFGKATPAATASVSPSPHAPTPQAAFAGFIEPAANRPIAAAELEISELEILPASSHPAPAVAPAMYVSKPLISQEPKKKNPTPIDWNVIPRFFESLK